MITNSKKFRNFLITQDECLQVFGLISSVWHVLDLHLQEQKHSALQDWLLELLHQRRASPGLQHMLHSALNARQWPCPDQMHHHSLGQPYPIQQTCTDTNRRKGTPAGGKRKHKRLGKVKIGKGKILKCNIHIFQILVLNLLFRVHCFLYVHKLFRSLFCGLNPQHSDACVAVVPMAINMLQLY